MQIILRVIIVLVLLILITRVLPALCVSLLFLRLCIFISMEPEETLLPENIMTDQKKTEKSWLNDLQME